MSSTVLIVTDNTADKIRETVLSIAEIETVTATSCVIRQRSRGRRLTQAYLSPRSRALPLLLLRTLARKPLKLLNQTRLPAPPKVKGVPCWRVDAEKLDSLLNLVGELVINKTRLSADRIVQSAAGAERSH